MKIFVMAKNKQTEIKDIFCNINTGLLYNVLPPFAKKEIEWKASSAYMHTQRNLIPLYKLFII